MSRQSESPFGGELWQGWKRFCQVVFAGAVAVFLFEIGTLVASLDDFGGMEQGALWAMLLMIFCTLGVVAVIGGGLARAIGRDRRRRAAEPGDEPPS